MCEITKGTAQSSSFHDDDDGEDDAAQSGGGGDGLISATVAHCTRSDITSGGWWGISHAQALPSAIHVGVLILLLPPPTMCVL